MNILRALFSKEYLFDDMSCAGGRNVARREGRKEKIEEWESKRVKEGGKKDNE